MKYAWFSFVVSAVLFSSFAGAQSSDTAAKKPGPEDGTIVDNIYSNECLGFSLPIPAGWGITDEVVGTEARARYLPSGMLSLLVIARYRERRNRIAVTAASGAAVTAEDFVTNSVHMQINVNRQTRELVRDAFAVDFGGKHFFRADYKQSLNNGTPLYLAFVFTKFRGNIIGDILLAGSPDELEESVSSLQRISFREDEPSPTCTIGPEDAPASPAIIAGVIGSALNMPQFNSARPQRVRVSQGVSTGLLVTKVPPHYPEDARQARIQGTVVLKALIDTNGDVEDLTLVSGHPLLAPAALEAVKQWKYKPYLLNGQPVKVETQIMVNFQLAAH